MLSPWVQRAPWCLWQRVASVWQVCFLLLLGTSYLVAQPFLPWGLATCPRQWDIGGNFTCHLQAWPTKKSSLVHTMPSLFLIAGWMSMPRANGKAHVEDGRFSVVLGPWVTLWSRAPWTPALLVIGLCKSRIRCSIMPLKFWDFTLKAASVNQNRGGQK